MALVAGILFVLNECFTSNNLLNAHVLQSFDPLIKKEDYLFQE
jgi:hypothetical protein